MNLFMYLFGVICVFFIAGVQSTTPAATCVATYHSIGIYWKAATGSPAHTCNVKYRPDGTSTYTQGLDLVWDDRLDKNVSTGYFNHSKEYRGSLVRLKPHVKYNIYLTVNQTGETVYLACSTWTESYIINSTVQLHASSQTLNITTGGTSKGYVRYVGPAVIDVTKAKSQYAVFITAPYVILDNVTIVGGTSSALRIGGNAHDVIIQNSDISGWGTTLCDGYGRNYDAGISAESNNWNITRLTIQRNVIRDPQSTANGWCDPIVDENHRCQAGVATPAPIHASSGCNFHPQGPQGIVFWNASGNNVIRYNRISAGIQTNHYFNDGIGGGSNASPTGFPGANSDVYGNWMGHSMDDSMEIEGGGMNVRVWHNFINETYTGPSSGVCSVGPLYIFSNVMYYSRRSPRSLNFTDNSSGPFAKLGDFNGYGGGRRFYFHNTMLTQPLEGGRPGLGDSAGPMTNTWSRNNIWWLTTISYSKTSPCCSASNFLTDGNNIDYDLCSNNPSSSYYTTHGIYNTVPIFKGGNWVCNNTASQTISCNVALNTTSKGYDAGVYIPGFNAGYYGNAPDLGAQEYNAPLMQFGIHATV